MPASRTPRRDAVELWLRSGRQGDIPWPIGEPEPPVIDDPESWSDPDVRLEAALMTAGGGARAELPVRAKPSLLPVWAPPWPPPRPPKEPPT